MFRVWKVKQIIFIAIRIKRNGKDYINEKMFEDLFK